MVSGGGPEFAAAGLNRTMPFFRKEEISGKFLCEPQTVFEAWQEPIWVGRMKFCFGEIVSKPGKSPLGWPGACLAEEHS